MELRQEHLHVAFAALGAAQDGGGVVLDDPGLYVAAHSLAEAGLARAPVRDRGWSDVVVVDTARRPRACGRR
jgi:hypothetical protein